MSSTVDENVLTTRFTMNEGRLIARIISLAERNGCSYTRISVTAGPGGYDTEVDFTGNPDALRRLDSQLHKLLLDDKETFS